GVADQFDQVFVVVDDENLAFAAIEGVGRDAVVPHEGVELVARDAAKTAARDAETFELPGVEAADDCLLADLTNLRGFAGREHGLHSLLTTSLLSRWSPRRVCALRRDGLWRAGQAPTISAASRADAPPCQPRKNVPLTLGCVTSWIAGYQLRI